MVNGALDGHRRSSQGKKREVDMHNTTGLMLLAFMLLALMSILLISRIGPGAHIIYSPGIDAVDDCYGYGICR